VRSSNAGHVLLGGLASYDRASRVADGLMTGECFSGWGIRTLAAGEARYNPISYHNGSIWPHDNAMIAMGLGTLSPAPADPEPPRGLVRCRAVHGAQPAAGALLRLFPAQRHGADGLSRRLLAPGLGGGRPFAVLGALLGVSFAPQERQIRFIRPTLPPWLEVLEISNLRLGDASVDLQLRRSREDVGLTVLRRDGTVEVVVTS
jgi:Glycogen debranching enzyme